MPAVPFAQHDEATRADILAFIAWSRRFWGRDPAESDDQIADIVEDMVRNGAPTPREPKASAALICVALSATKQVYQHARRSRILRVANAFPLVELSATLPECCTTARAAHGRRWPSTDPPLLPLEGCAADGNCLCGIRTLSARQIALRDAGAHDAATAAAIRSQAASK